MVIPDQSYGAVNTDSLPPDMLAQHSKQPNTNLLVEHIQDVLVCTTNKHANMLRHHINNMNSRPRCANIR